MDTRWSFFSHQQSRWCKHGGVNTFKHHYDTHAWWYMDCDVDQKFPLQMSCSIRFTRLVNASWSGGSTHTPSSVEHISSSGVVLPVTDHQLCNPADSTASLTNGSCQRDCQSIGCSFWVCLVGRRGALHSAPLCSVTGKAPTLLISFFTALCQHIQPQTFKDLRLRPTSAAARHFFRTAEPWALCFWEGVGKAWWAVKVEDDWRTQSKAISSSFFFPPAPCSLSSLTQRKCCILTGSHWIHVVIHRPISNCHAAKLH